MTFERGISVIHSDDLPRFRRTVDEALRDHKPTIAPCGYCVMTAPLASCIRADGRSTITTVRPVRMYGTVQDVTERTQGRGGAGRRARGASVGTFENAAVGIAHRDLQGRCLRVNEKFCSIVGYSRGELLEKRFQDITHPEDLTDELGLHTALLRGSRPATHCRSATSARTARSSGPS